MVETGVVPLFRFAASVVAVSLQFIDQRRKSSRRLEDGVDVAQTAFAFLELLGNALEIGEAFEVVVSDDVAEGGMQKMVHDGQTLWGGGGEGVGYGISREV